MVQAGIFQDAWNILMGAIIVITIAATMNWRNSRTDLWINLTLVSLLDIPFILFVIVPGYAPLWQCMLKGRRRFPRAGPPAAAGIRHQSVSRRR